MRKKYSGFTLVELLVVAGIFLVIISVVLSIIITVLRGTKNSDSINIVKENGERAMTQIVRELRFAESLVTPSYRGGASPSCSSAGTVVQSVRIIKIDKSELTFNCPTSFSYPNSISQNSTINITNRDGVVVNSCRFVCTQNVTGQPNIGIFFTLSKVNSSGLPEEHTTIPFQSSVLLRNVVK